MYLSENNATDNGIYRSEKSISDYKNGCNDSQDTWGKRANDT